MDRWPNWIRREATNFEIPDSSSGRSTKNKKIESNSNIESYIKYFMDRWPNWIRREATNFEIPDSSSGRSTKKI